MVVILHVDNEPDTVELVRVLMTREGFEFIAAYSGKECLEKLKNNKVDLVLLDIMMPDMSGWDVYRQINKMANMPKVAFLSVIDVSEERRHVLLESGIADYITKPFDNEDLVKKVKKIVGVK